MGQMKSVKEISLSTLKKYQFLMIWFNFSTLTPIKLKNYKYSMDGTRYRIVKR